MQNSVLKALKHVDSYNHVKYDAWFDELGIQIIKTISCLKIFAVTEFLLVIAFSYAIFIF